MPTDPPPHTDPRADQEARDPLLDPGFVGGPPDPEDLPSADNAHDPDAGDRPAYRYRATMADLPGLTAIHLAGTSIVYLPVSMAILLAALPTTAPPLAVGMLIGGGYLASLLLTVIVGMIMARMAVAEADDAGVWRDRLGQAAVLMTGVPIAAGVVAVIGVMAGIYSAGWEVMDPIGLAGWAPVLMAATLGLATVPALQARLYRRVGVMVAATHDEQDIDEIHGAILRRGHHSVGGGADIVVLIGMLLSLALMVSIVGPTADPSFGMTGAMGTRLVLSTAILLLLGLFALGEVRNETRRQASIVALLTERLIDEESERVDEETRAEVERVAREVILGPGATTIATLRLQVDRQDRIRRWLTDPPSDPTPAELDALFNAGTTGEAVATQWIARQTADHAPAPVYEAPVLRAAESQRLSASDSMIGISLPPAASSSGRYSVIEPDDAERRPIGGNSRWVDAVDRLHRTLAELATHSESMHQVLHDQIAGLDGAQHQEGFAAWQQWHDRLGHGQEDLREIADRAEILALNASLEGVRAGEAGRGFVLVAQEIRRVTERTRQASSDLGAIAEGQQQARFGFEQQWAASQQSLRDLISATDLLAREARQRAEDAAHLYRSMAESPASSGRRAAGAGSDEEGDTRPITPEEASSSSGPAEDDSVSSAE